MKPSNIKLALGPDGQIVYGIQGRLRPFDPYQILSISMILYCVAK